MTVGTQMTSSQVDQTITNLSVTLRDVCWAIKNLSTNVNGQANGAAYLQSIGYSSGDATTALAAISYLNTISGVYYGVATQATDFNFDNQLSQYWAGR